MQLAELLHGENRFREITLIDHQSAFKLGDDDVTK